MTNLEKNECYKIIEMIHWHPTRDALNAIKNLDENQMKLMHRLTNLRIARIESILRNMVQIEIWETNYEALVNNYFSRQGELIEENIRYRRFKDLAGFRGEA